MSAAIPGLRPWPLSFSTLVTFLVAIFVVAIPGCWAAETYYGVDKVVASNTLWSVYSLLYFIVLGLPWLNLKGQEHFGRAERLERMCIAWLCLITAPHLIFELTWVVLFDPIIASKGQLWSFLWWSYLDGGDSRYVTRDVYVLSMETGASIIGITTGILLLSWRKSRKFTDAQLMVVMALMVCDFYPTYVYYVTEMWRGFPSVASVADLVIKFIAANSPYLVMPWVVFVWAGRQLLGSRRKNLS